MFLGSVWLVEGDFFLPKMGINAALSNYHYSLRGYTLKSISRGIKIAIASAAAKRCENVFKSNFNQCLPREIESFQLQKRKGIISTSSRVMHPFSIPAYFVFTSSPPTVCLSIAAAALPSPVGLLLESTFPC